MNRLTQSLLSLAAIALGSPNVHAQTQSWIRQFGTSLGSSFAPYERAQGTAPDGLGGLFVGGETPGSLGGPNAGAQDAWLARYDGAGGRLWITQFGSSAADELFDAASDGAGGAYVCGATSGSLGGPFQGGQGQPGGLPGGDAWLARFDGSGIQLWIRQLGTSADDVPTAVAADAAGFAYVAGRTLGALGGPFLGGSPNGDAWLACYDSTGALVWIRQIGTSADDVIRAAAASSAGVLVCGHTYGNLGSPSAGSGDAWVASFDGAGNQQWLQQFGTGAMDVAFAASSDGASGFYVGGVTNGALAGPQVGMGDAWVAHYDAGGARTWIRQLGSGSQDSTTAIAPDGAGGAFVGGATSGNLAGSNAGPKDVWLAHFDGQGNQLGIVQFGTTGDEMLPSASSDGSGGVYLAGGTGGSLGGPSAGGEDAWLARYHCGGTPSVYCTGKVSSLGCTPSIGLSGPISAGAGVGCTLDASSLVGGVLGLFFHSTAGSQAKPFHGGFLCVQPPLRRHPVQGTGGTVGSCDGVLTEDLNAYVASGADPALVAGAGVWLQAWSRDPGDPFGDSLSDAVTAVICP